MMNARRDVAKYCLYKFIWYILPRVTTQLQLVVVVVVVVVVVIVKEKVK